MDFDIMTLEDCRTECNTVAYLRNLIIKGDEEGNYHKYQDRLKETYTKVEPVREALLKAYDDLRDVTGTKGTMKLRRMIIALGGFK